MTKFTYWTSQVEENALEDKFDCRFLAEDQRSKAKQFSRLARPSLSDILKARNLLGIPADSKFNYDQQDEIIAEKPVAVPTTQPKTSLQVRKGETHLRRRSSTDGPPQTVPRVKKLKKIDRRRLKKKALLVKRQLSRDNNKEAKKSGSSSSLY